MHPELKGKLKLNQNAFIFKLDLDMMIAAVNETVPRFKKLPAFPEVQRDLAVIVPVKTSWDELEKVIKKALIIRYSQEVKSLTYIKVNMLRMVSSLLRSG